MSTKTKPKAKFPWPMDQSRGRALEGIPDSWRGHCVALGRTTVWCADTWARLMMTAVEDEAGRGSSTWEQLIAFVGSLELATFEQLYDADRMMMSGGRVVADSLKIMLREVGRPVIVEAARRGGATRLSLQHAPSRTVPDDAPSKPGVHRLSQVLGRRAKGRW
jgi:hypothetical protein